MNQQTELFLAELKQRSDVLGVILFGSWARGNNRPDSDVDLVVILSSGYQRTIEVREQQVFEIIYTTAPSALEYWASHKDDAAGLWAVAKILYDKDCTIAQLQDDIKRILAEGKSRINPEQLKQIIFDAQDQLRYVRYIMADDATTANLILANKVFYFTGLFFDLQQMWIPAPKQRLGKIKELNLAFYSLLEKFYQQPNDLTERLAITEQMLPMIFCNRVDQS